MIMKDIAEQTKPGVSPIHPDSWPPDLKYILDQLQTPLNIYNTMAHHPALLKAWMVYRQHIVCDSTLTPRQRELVTLRNAWNTQTLYEWEHHLRRGLDAGLLEKEISRVKEGPAAEGWHENESSLLQAVDDLNTCTEIQASTWDILNKYYDVQQILDIICTVGMYITLACILKSCKVPLEKSLTEHL